MKFFIHQNTLNNHKSESGKAIYFTISTQGFNSSRHIEWFPLSQLRISEKANENGWYGIEIPDWLLNKKVKNQSIEELEVFSCIDEKENNF